MNYELINQHLLDNISRACGGSQTNKEGTMDKKQLREALLDLISDFKDEINTVRNGEIAEYTDLFTFQQFASFLLTSELDI